MLLLIALLILLFALVGGFAFNHWLFFLILVALIVYALDRPRPRV